MMDMLCESLAGQHVYLFTDDQEAFYKACGFAPRGVGVEEDRRSLAAERQQMIRGAQNPRLIRLAAAMRVSTKAPP